MSEVSSVESAKVVCATHERQIDKGSLSIGIATISVVAVTAVPPQDKGFLMMVMVVLGFSVFYGLRNIITGAIMLAKSN